MAASLAGTDHHSFDSIHGAGPSMTQGIGASRAPVLSEGADGAKLRAAFQRLASVDSATRSDTISLTEWKLICKKHLRLDVQEAELERVWARLTRDQSAPLSERELTFHQFREGASRLAFLRQVVSGTLSDEARRFEVASDYDYSTSTNDAYRCDDRPRKFYGEYASIRAVRDYSYHVNYTEARQKWQDAIIKSCVVRTDPQVQPWVVYTCGPMGAGKGYTLAWMSRQGYFPLENIVHIDPDYFKSVMPEWDGYVKCGTKAGDMCHRESGFVQEIAQEVAMRSRQNVWVDGSLRDGQWFKTVFQNIRRNFPHYKIAIFVVTVPEATVRARIAARQAKTGRGVPEELIVESLKGVATSVDMLTPLADFVARIENVDQPKLVAYQTVDTSGNWGSIRTQFANEFPTPGEFPAGLAPLSLRSVSLRPETPPAAAGGAGAGAGAGATAGAGDIGPATTLEDDAGGGVEGSTEATASPAPTAIPIIRVRDAAKLSDWSNVELIQADLVPEALAAAEASAHLGSLAKVVGSTNLVLSPAHSISLNDMERARAGIPPTASAYVYCYPALHVDWARIQSEDVDVTHPLARLVVAGGFVYFDSANDICSINAVLDVGLGEAAEAPDGLATKDPLHVLQFGTPAPLPAVAVEYLAAHNRLRPVTLAVLLHKGARHYAWIKPGEMLPGLQRGNGRQKPGAQVIPPKGAFAYVFRDVDAPPDARDRYFPVA